MDAANLANEFEYYNAAGVLIVHSAIAMADALTIKRSGVKCTGENHLEIISLVKDVIQNNPKRNTALKHLESIISIKSLVSYSGDIYYKKDIDKLFKHLNRFYYWAESILE